MDKILITGSSGFIGSHLKEALPDAVGLDWYPSDTTDIIADVRKFKLKEHYDIIFHLAAITEYERYMKYPHLTLDINTLGTVNLLKQLKRELFVFASTIGVPKKDWDNPYILSKALAEKAVSMMRRKSVILRFHNIYGKRSNSVVSKFINSWEIHIYGDGSNERDYVYIDDLITHLKAVKKLKHRNVYHIGTGTMTDLNTLAELISSKQAGKPILHKPKRQGDAKTSSSSVDLKCPTTLEEGIDKILFKNNP